MVRIIPGGSGVKASASHVGDPDWIPELGRPPGEGTGNPLQYSFLENPMDRGAWQAIVHGVARSQTQMSNFTFTFTFIPGEARHDIFFLGQVALKKRWASQSQNVTVRQKFFDFV